jgi:hypothetical protein
LKSGADAHSNRLKNTTTRKGRRRGERVASEGNDQEATASTNSASEGQAMPQTEGVEARSPMYGHVPANSEASVDAQPQLEGQPQFDNSLPSNSETNESPSKADGHDVSVTMEDNPLNQVIQEVSSMSLDADRSVNPAHKGKSVAFSTYMHIN